MKNFFIVFALLAQTLVAHAQTCEDKYPEKPDQTEDKRRELIEACQLDRSRNGSRTGNSNNGNNNVPFTNCDRLFQGLSPAPQPVATVLGATYFNAKGPAGLIVADTPPAPLSASVSPGLPVVNNEKIQDCRGFEAVATGLGAGLSTTQDKVSQDGRITCVQKSGITADWESCTSALSMYNTILIAEVAMQAFQGVQTNRVNTQTQNEVGKRAAAGDAQNAAFDAQTATLNNAKALNQQQAATYAAAVAALYSKIQSWIKESDQAVIQKACSGSPSGQNKGAPAAAQKRLYASLDAIPSNEFCAPSVTRAINTYNYGSFIFANRQAKGQFTNAAMMFAAKAIKAGITASQLGAVAQKVQEAKKQTENEFDAPTFERCQIDPTNPACAGPVTRTNGSGLQEGGFGFGDSFGNNAFTPLGDEEKLGDIAPLPLPGDETVAGVTNPFADDAKAASGILDPAGAASVQPGAAGGGGGGGASAPGGGSASLGNDTPGADDSKKENDIKANKADGKYNLAGGGAFQAIKPMKDENPFANLFDGKGGKLEEDRSIASGDIDGQDSGLFSKISKRYSLIQADKRIEARNADE